MPLTFESAMNSPKERDILSGLPEEIVEIVANHTAEHVIALRQTCRELQHKTWRTFSQRFFTTRHVWIDKVCLDKLQEIAADARLARCVRTIQFHFYKWEWKRFLRGIEPRPELIKAYHLANEQQYLLDGGQAAEQLVRSVHQFSDLDCVEFPSRNNVLKLWPNTHFKLPTPLIQGERYLAIADESDAFATKVWLLIFRALAASNIRLKNVDSYVDIPFRGMSTLPRPIIESLSAPLSSLEVLDVCFEVPSNNFEHDHWQKSFALLLHSGLNVTKLCLEFHGQTDRLHGWEQRPFSMSSLTSWPTFKKLHHLRLTGLQVTPVALIEFLGRNYSSLKALILHELYVGASEEGWRPLLESIPSTATLELLELTVDTDEDAFDVVSARTPDITKAIAKALKEGPEATFSEEMAADLAALEELSGSDLGDEDDDDVVYELGPTHGIPPDVFPPPGIPPLPVLGDPHWTAAHWLPNPRDDYDDEDYESDGF